MKKFIKNSFLMLIRSKAVLVLLFFFSFLASVMLLTYDNSRKSHLNAYETVMKKGEIADIGVYENYDYTFAITSQKQGEQYKFSFQNPSNYVKDATRNNPDHYPIHRNVGGEEQYFQPWKPDFFWLDTLNPDENISAYIDSKTSLLLDQLRSDVQARAVTHIQNYMDKTYPGQKNKWISQEEEEISLTLDKTSYELIQVDSNYSESGAYRKLDKLVYSAGSDAQLYAKIDGKDINLDFRDFQKQFNNIRNWTPNSKEPKYSTASINLLRGIYANFPTEYVGSDAYKTLGQLIDNYSTAIQHGSTDLANPCGTISTITKPLDDFIKEKELAPINSPTEVGGRHRFALSVKGTIAAAPIILANPCIYQAVISNANVLHGRYRYSQAAYDEWKSFLARSDGSRYSETAISQKLHEIRERYPNSVISLGSNNACLYLIVGVGITPNYIFPVLQTNPSTNVGNLDNAVFMYTLSGGRDLAYSCYYSSSNVLTTTLFAKFPGLKHHQVQKLVDSVNAYAHNKMALYGIDSAYFINNPSGLNLITGLRVSFLPTLTKKISSIFVFVCSAIWFLVLIISFFVTRDIIEKNRYILSIFNSNGFSLLKLIASFSLALLLPSVVGCLVGFGVGIAAQQLMNTFLGQYWITVSPKLAVSWLSFGFSFVVFNAILALFSFLVGVFVTRKNLVASLKNEINYKSSKFEVFFKKLFFFTPIMTRFRISIAFNAIQKMLILAMMILITIVTFGLFTSTVGKFKEAKDALSRENYYGYAVDLNTPTTQSGPIRYINVYDLGKTAPGFSNTGNPIEVLQDWKNLQFSTVTTFAQYHTTVTFLQNMVSSRIQLDFYYGSDSTIRINLWNVVKGMMPLNQMIASNSAYTTIMEYLYNLPGNKATGTGAGQVFIGQDQKTKNFVLTPRAYRSVGGFNIGISDDFAEFLKVNFFDQQKSLALRKNPINNYSITYGNLGLDPQIIGERHFYNNDKHIYEPPKYGFLKVENQENIDLYGIQNNDLSDANYLGPRLYLSNGSPFIAANKLLFVPTTKTIHDPNTENVYPIIINRAMAMERKLKVGSLISLTPTNTADRISRELYPNWSKDHPIVPVKLKVVGVSRGSKNPSAYISYANANKILRFDDQNHNYYYFNGFYTSKTDPMRFLNNVLTLYSPSGLYPATQDFDESFISLLDTVINRQDPEQLGILSRALGIRMQDLDAGEARNYTKKLRKYYSYPYTLLWKTIFSTKGDLEAFDTVSHVTSTLLILSIAVIMLMVFFIVILISILSMNNLKNIGVRLQVFGYDYRKILGSMLSIYLPALILGFGVSYPILQTVINVFTSHFFNLTGIALTLSLPIIGIMIGTSVVIFLLLVSAFVCYYNFKRIELAKSIKGFLDI